MSRKSDFYAVNLDTLADDQFLQSAYQEQQPEDDWITQCLGDSEDLIDYYGNNSY